MMKPDKWGYFRMRDRKIVAFIDKNIKEFYPEHGPDYVAEIVKEDRRYIMSRAGYLKISRNTKATMGTIEDLKDQIRILKSRNKALRLENIKLIGRRM